MSVLRESRLTKPLVTFATAEYFHTLVLLFSTVVFVFFTTKDYIPMGARFVMPALLILLVTVREMRLRAILLIWVVLGLASNVYANFYVTANHGFMITYIGLALLISCSARENGAVLMQRSAVFLISILMGLALIQKLVSGYYMSGNLIGTYLATGQMFQNLLSLLVPDWLQMVQDNLAAQKALIADAGVTSVAISVPPVVQGIAIVLTYVALASQAGLEVIILMRRRFGVWTHYSVLAFVLIIYSTRNENVFLSMNLILGYAMTDDASKSVRIWYVIGVFYLMAMQMMGLRPGIIG